MDNSEFLQEWILSTRQYPFLNESIDELLTLCPEIINIKYKGGETALMKAALNSKHKSSIETVKILLKHGANIHLKNAYGCTAFMLCVCSTKYYSSFNVAKLLLEHGTNINERDNNGNTSLMIVSGFMKQFSSNEIVKFLLDSGADINLQSGKGETALMKTIFNLNRFSSIRTIVILLSYKPNINLKNRCGETALSLFLEHTSDKNFKRIFKKMIEMELENETKGSLLIETLRSETPKTNFIIKSLFPTRKIYMKIVFDNITKISEIVSKFRNVMNMDFKLTLNHEINSFNDILNFI